MAYDGTLIFDTKIDTSGFTSSMGKLGKLATKSIGAVTASISTAGTALVGLGGAAIRAGINFESAFAGVKKTVNGTAQELNALREGIVDLAGEMPMTADAIAGIAESAGQLGIEKENILQFTKTMADLGVATNLAGEEAASTLAKFANITGMDQGNFDRLGSTIVALGNNLATTEADIAAMAMRLAGTGKQIGLSEAQILSFAGALSSVGVEAEAGGTAFSKVFKDLQLAVETGNADLQNFATVAGMSAKKFKEEFQKNAAGAILAFIDGLGKSEERGVSVVKVLNDLGITEERMSDALSRASGAADLFTNALEIGTGAWKENTALTAEAEQRYATMESRLAILKNRVTELGIAFYESTNADIGSAVDLLGEYVGQIQEAFENDGLTGAIDALGDIIGDLAVRLAEAAPDILEAGADLIGKLADSLMENADAVGDAAARVAVLLVETIQKLIPQITELAGQILKSFAKGLGDALPILKPFTAALEGLAKNIKLVTAAFVACKVASSVSKIFNTINKSANVAAKAIATKTLADKALQAAQTRGITISALKLKYDYVEVANLKTSQIATSLLTGKTTLLTAAKALCTKAQHALNAAWAANPVGLVVAGVVALGAAIAVLVGLTKKETEEEKRKREELEAQKEALEERKRAVQEDSAAAQEARQSHYDTAAAELAQLQRTQDLTKELEGLVDVNGQVGEANKNRVSFILGELSGALGKEYKLVGNVIDGYDTLIDDVYKLIEAKKLEALMNAAQENYNEAVTKKGEQANKVLADYQALDAKKKELAAAEKALSDYTNQAIWSTAKENELKAAVEQAKSSVTELEGFYTQSSETYQKYLEDEATYTHAHTLALAGETDAAIAYLEAQAGGVLDLEAAIEKHGDNADATLGELSNTYQIRLVELVAALKQDAENASDESLSALKTALGNMNTVADEFGAVGGKIENSLIIKPDGTQVNLGPLIDEMLLYAAQTETIGADFALGFINNIGTSEQIQKAIQRASSLVNKSMEAMKTEAKINSPSKETGYLGEDFVAGFVNAITDGEEEAGRVGGTLASSALSGIQETQDSHSASKETGYLGEDFVAGYIEAISAGTADAKEAAGTLASSTLQELQKYMPEGMEFKLDHSEWKISEEGQNALEDLKFYREIGKISGEQYYQELQKWRDKYLKRGTKDWWDYTREIADGNRELAEETAETEKKLLKEKLEFGQISEEEYYRELARLRDTHLEEGSEAWISYTKEIAQYQKDRIVSLYKDMAEEAGKRIDEVLKLQENMEKKLQDFVASPYDTIEIKSSTGSRKERTRAEEKAYQEELAKIQEMYPDVNVYELAARAEHATELEYTETSLHDYTADNNALEEYLNNLLALKNRGDIPSELLDEIGAMSVEEGMTYVKLLLEASDAEFQAHMNGWKKNRELTSEIPRKYFQDEAEEVARSLTTALEEVGKSVPEGFFDNGKTAAENFGEGFISKIEEVALRIKGAFTSKLQGLLPELSYAGGIPVYGGGTTNYISSVVNVSAMTPAEQARLEKDIKVSHDLGGNT